MSQQNEVKSMAISSLDEAPAFLKVSEVENLFRAGERSVRRMIKENNLEVRVGNNIRVPKKSLIEFIRNQTSENKA